MHVREYPLDRPVLTIGRHGEEDVAFDRMGVLGRRIQVRVDRRSVMLIDLKGTNGTFAIGHRVDNVR